MSIVLPLPRFSRGWQAASMSTGASGQAPEAAVVRLNRAKRTLSDVYLTAFQHRQQLGTNRVEQLDLHIGIALARSGARNSQ